MFYKTGVDITNDKQMFTFLKNHISQEYYNGFIVNEIKIFQKKFLKLLKNDNYSLFNDIILSIRQKYPNYLFNFTDGKNCFYVVMVRKAYDNKAVIPVVNNCIDYQDYKRFCKENFGSVKANHMALLETTRLVQDFDRICDQINDRSKVHGAKMSSTTIMKSIVENFNDEYSNDLHYLGFKKLWYANDGSVDIAEIYRLRSLAEAFLRKVDKTAPEFHLRYLDAVHVILEDS